MKKVRTFDKSFLGLTLLLASVGLFIFTSASFGLFFRKGFSLQDLLFGQIVLGLILGLVAMYIAYKMPLKLLREYSLHIFIGSAILTLLVFVPHVGLQQIKGAHRWINLWFTSFQPSEALKLGAVIYFAALLPLFKDRISTLKYSFITLAGVLVVPAIILLLEPDTGTLGVLAITLVGMLLAAGMKIRHFFLFFIIALALVAGLAVARPYVRERLLTFFDSSRDPQGSSYQIQKSLLAIGSGGITGRGFGQSIQKFGSLPEPTGDSIFAVAGEEFGFIGAGAIILLFLLFGVRGIKIAQRSPDMFSGLLAVGIVILVVSQSFANIAAMLGLIPLTGVPLVFVSHGGTALLFAFLEIGILLNISKLSRT